MVEARDVSTFWKPQVGGIELLHAHFRRHEYPRHTHEMATIALMDVGAARFFYRGEVHTASAGDVFFINPGEVHTGGLAHPDGYGYRVIYLRPDRLDWLFAQRPDGTGGGSVAFGRTVVRDAQLAVLLDRVHTALVSGIRHGYGLFQEQALLNVGGLLRRYAGIGRVAERAPSDSADGALRRRAVAAARDYLEFHLADRVLLAELAEATGTSLFWLSRVFTDEVGMPPHAYQNSRRVDRAKRLLADGSPPTRVAGEVGFCDQAHFTRVFKRYTGTTPRRFALDAAR